MDKQINYRGQIFTIKEYNIKDQFSGKIENFKGWGAVDEPGIATDILTAVVSRLDLINETGLWMMEKYRSKQQKECLEKIRNELQSIIDPDDRGC